MQSNYLFIISLNFIVETSFHTIQLDDDDDVLS